MVPKTAQGREDSTWFCIFIQSPSVTLCCSPACYKLQWLCYLKCKLIINFYKLFIFTEIVDTLWIWASTLYLPSVFCPFWLPSLFLPCCPPFSSVISLFLSLLSHFPSTFSSCLPLPTPCLKYTDTLTVNYCSNLLNYIPNQDSCGLMCLHHHVSAIFSLESSL